jgi:cytochrome c5
MKKGIGSFIFLTIISWSLMSCGGEKKTDGENGQAKTEAADQTAEIADPSIDLAAGEATYNQFCFACHKDGIAGAPKLGDKELWGPRAEKGMATLVKHVTEGYTGDAGIMPPMGTCMTCTEQDFKNSISFMLSKAGLEAK